MVVLVIVPVFVSLDVAQSGTSRKIELSARCLYKRGSLSLHKTLRLPSSA